MNTSPDPSPERRSISIRTIGWIIIAFLGIVILGLLAYTVPLAQDRAAAARATPTPPCITPSLRVGSTLYLLKSAPLAADGSLPAVAAGDTSARWVEGTSSPYVVVLPDTSKTQALKGQLVPGSLATITWADCGREEYQVTGLEDVPTNPGSLAQQTGSGLVLVAPGFVVRGARPGLAPGGTPTAAAGSAGAQSSITFLDNGVTADGKEIHMRIEVANTGSQAFTIQAGEISLATENGQEAKLLGANPALPQAVAPGQKVELVLDFINPMERTLVFKILDASMELYY